MVEPPFGAPRNGVRPWANRSGPLSGECHNQRALISRPLAFLQCFMRRFGEDISAHLPPGVVAAPWGKRCAAGGSTRIAPFLISGSYLQKRTAAECRSERKKSAEGLSLLSHLPEWNPPAPDPTGEALIRCVSSGYISLCTFGTASRFTAHGGRTSSLLNSSFGWSQKRSRAQGDFRPT